MAELSLLLFVLASAGLAIAWPLLDRLPSVPEQADGEDGEALLMRHQLALEALRDIEADWRAGSLDEAAYRAQREEAEASAAETLVSARPQGAPAERRPVGSGRGTAVTLGIGVLALVLIGFALPAPVGIGERTVTNQGLADAIAAEDARQAAIAQLLDRLQADPQDADAWSQLADRYLAGASATDQANGARALLAVLTIDPENGSAYRRLITAYMNAGDWTSARSALDSYEKVAAEGEPDIPFFRGLLALRADDDPAEAVKQFDRFLELAPHDGRAGMVLTLREQASEQAGGT